MRARPDEPQAHYSARLSFIDTLLTSASGKALPEGFVETLPQYHTGVKFKAMVYKDDNMELLRYYYPGLATATSPDRAGAEQIGLVTVS